MAESWKWIRDDIDIIIERLREKARELEDMEGTPEQRDELYTFLREQYKKIEKLLDGVRA